MPYSIRKIGKNKYQVYNPATGEIHSKGTTKKKAEGQFRLLSGVHQKKIVELEGGNVLGSLSDSFGAFRKGVAEKQKQVINAITPTPIKQAINQVARTFVGDEMPNNVKAMLSQYGDQPITGLTLGRTPVPAYINQALNVVSFGEWKKKFANAPYDTLYHLFLIIQTVSGRFLIEKNERINASATIPTNAQLSPISGSFAGLTPNILLDNTKQQMGERFYSYSAVNNNCQDFIMSLMKANNLGSPADYAFVKQDTESLFKNSPQTSAFANTLTDLGARFSKILGRGRRPRGGVSLFTFNGRNYDGRDAYKGVSDYLNYAKSQPVVLRDMTGGASLSNPDIRRYVGEFVDDKDIYLNMLSNLRRRYMANPPPHDIPEVPSLQEIIDNPDAVNSSILANEDMYRDLVLDANTGGMDVDEWDEVVEWLSGRDPEDLDMFQQDDPLDVLREYSSSNLRYILTQLGVNLLNGQPSPETDDIIGNQITRREYREYDPVEEYEEAQKDAMDALAEDDDMEGGVNPRRVRKDVYSRREKQEREAMGAEDTPRRDKARDRMNQAINQGAMGTQDFDLDRVIAMRPVARKGRRTAPSSSPRPEDSDSDSGDFSGAFSRMFGQGRTGRGQYQPTRFL